jgi:hypothetical protein
MLTLGSDIKGGAQNESDWEQAVEQNFWTDDSQSEMKLERNA